MTGLTSNNEAEELVFFATLGPDDPEAPLEIHGRLQLVEASTLGSA